MNNANMQLSYCHSAFLSKARVVHLSLFYISPPCRTEFGLFLNLLSTLKKKLLKFSQRLIKMGLLAPHLEKRVKETFNMQLSNLADDTV